MEKLNRKEQPTVKSTSGQAYVITGQGKVKKKQQKKPMTLSDLSEVVLETEKEMSEHLLVIYKALRAKDPDATFKKGVIDCRMFRISFDENGFFIRDLKDFNKKCDFTYEDVFPTPREIWEYITRPRIKNSSDEEEVTRMNKIKKYRGEVAPKKEVEIVVNKPKEEKVEINEVYLNNQRKKALQTLNRTKDVKNVIKKLPELLPHRGFKVLFGKIVRDLKNKKIRADKFKRLTKELIETVSFAEKLKPAPKFIGVPFWKISELTVTDNKVNMVMNNGKDKYSVFKCEFLARYILAEEPSVMPQLMKYLKGVITKADFLKTRIAKDRFVGFDNSLLHKDTFNNELFEVCEEILYIWGLHNPLKVVYKNEIAIKLSKADKLVVYFEDSYTRYVGTVIEINEGIIIRYDEDGDIAPLMKHQKWNLV